MGKHYTVYYWSELSPYPQDSGSYSTLGMARHCASERLRNSQKVEIVRTTVKTIDTYFPTKDSEAADATPL